MIVVISFRMSLAVEVGHRVWQDIQDISNLYYVVNKVNIYWVRFRFKFRVYCGWGKFLSKVKTQQTCTTHFSWSQ